MQVSSARLHDTFHLCQTYSATAQVFESFAIMSRASVASRSATVWHQGLQQINAVSQRSRARGYGTISDVSHICFKGDGKSFDRLNAPTIQGRQKWCHAHAGRQRLIGTLTRCKAASIV